MKYCKKCLMPDTRPGISFNKEGVCSACQNHEKRKKINWEERWEELKKLCDKYRGINGEGEYDCAIAISGGKDSHYQVYLMKEVLKMNPILFSVEDNFTMTEAGKHNIKNISEAFGCNIVSLKPDIKSQKILMRKTFEKYGKPTWFIDRLIYTFPLRMALKFNTMLLIYGENVSYEYGGSDAKETYSAREILKNGVASDIPTDELLGEGITEKELYLTKAPSTKEIEKLDPIYISYFVPWNGIQNYNIAKRYGFTDLTHEWNRTHHVENFNQIDSYGYLFNGWMKYPKFGHAHATDHASRFVREGIWTQDYAIEKVKLAEPNPDIKMLEDFRKFVGYTPNEFYTILDKWYNRELFFKNDLGEWELKEPIWKEKK